MLYPIGALRSNGGTILYVMGAHNTGAEAIWDEITTVNQDLFCLVFNNFVNH